eukprot:gene11654-8037_t
MSLKPEAALRTRRAFINEIILCIYYYYYYYLFIYFILSGKSH